MHRSCAAAAAAAVQRARSVAKVRVDEEGAAPAHARHPFYSLADPEPRLPVEDGDIVASTQFGNDLIIVALSGALGRLQNLLCGAQLGLQASLLLLQAPRRRALLPAEERLRVLYGDADSVVQGLSRVQAATQWPGGVHATRRQRLARGTGASFKIQTRSTGETSGAKAENVQSKVGWRRDPKWGSPEYAAQKDCATLELIAKGSIEAQKLSLPAEGYAEGGSACIRASILYSTKQEASPASGGRSHAHRPSRKWAAGPAGQSASRAQAGHSVPRPPPISCVQCISLVGIVIGYVCARIFRGYAVLPGVDIRVMPVASCRSDSTLRHPSGALIHNKAAAITHYVRAFAPRGEVLIFCAEVLL